MYILKEKDILNVMRGATLMASGGGGAMEDGVIMLEAFKKAHPDKPVEVKVCTPDEMEAGSRAVVVAVMGAPSGGTGLDITPCMTNAYDEIQKLAQRYSYNVKYTMPIEMGGVNTFAPMLISLMSGVPIIDADAAGRAVPGLETALSAVNGCDTAPIAMADVHNNRTNIIVNDPKDAILVQSMASPIVAIFEQNAGIAGWMLSASEIKDAIPNGTITMARQIGEIIEKAAAGTGEHPELKYIFELINEAGIVNAQTLTAPQGIFQYTTELKDGWDVGYYYVGEKTQGFLTRYRVMFSNESLVLYRTDLQGRETVYMTAPDIITMYDAETGMPLTNEDLQQKKENGTLSELKVILGKIQVDEKWWKNPAAVEPVWKPYFEALGYTGKIVRF